MYAYWTFYSVPQVVKGLGSDQRGAVRAILVGSRHQRRAHRAPSRSSRSASRPR